MKVSHFDVPNQKPKGQSIKTNSLFRCDQIYVTLQFFITMKNKSVLITHYYK